MAPVLALGAAMACVGGVAATAADPQTLPPEVISAAERPAPYPTFASIPETPKNNPTPAQWKGQVVATRLQGARLTRAIGSLAWTPLGDTDAWGAQMRAEAAPPPQITMPFSAEDEARLAALRARASEPPRSR
jgi:hypothetical protein